MTIGRVTGIDASNHSSCDYVFSVDGRKYTSADSGCHREIGDTIAFTYLPSNPKLTAIDAPSNRLRGAVITNLGAPSMLAAPFAIMAYFRRRKQV